MEYREAECARYKAEIDRPRVEKQPCYLMVVASTVCASRETIEPIQVELSLEGCDFGELEEAREKFLEVARFVDDEASAVRLPAHDV